MKNQTIVAVSILSFLVVYFVAMVYTYNVYLDEKRTSDTVIHNQSVQVASLENKVGQLRDSVKTLLDSVSIVRKKTNTRNR